MVNGKYELWCEFCDTMEQALRIKEQVLKNANPYYKKHKKISITNWESQDGTEKKKLIWYYR